ncbi:hypothetical protein AYO44_15740 [Planctomycetaceae bacterium SCGC AG-212-F19]|nr:hypothetical protein AYO44_15740 [Planctomycetaceae bacterium SCGC AG-212-F19]
MILPKIGAGLLSLVTGFQTVAQQPATTTVPANKPIEIRIAPVTAPGPAVSITLGSRHGHATPHRAGCCHTGGGNTDVAQPSPDTVVITMSGVAVATGGLVCGASAGMDFELTQDFEVVFEKSDVKAAKLIIEARAIGLLRSPKGGGMAEMTHGLASVSSAGGGIIALAMTDHAVGAGENLSINDHEGPISVTLGAGKYTFCQTVHFLAAQPSCVLPCKAASAEFAPDPALDPLWISYLEPFHGAAKKDFGFQVTIKVAQDTDAPAAPEPKQPDPLPLEPKKAGSAGNPPQVSPTGVQRIQFEQKK